MKCIFGLSRIRHYRKPVVALGVFDGVHLAHRAILKAAIKKARQIQGTSMALTFFPHPQKQKSLYSLEHRLRLIADLGIEVGVVISFNRRFARISAEDFIRRILAQKIGCSYVYVGENFRFGRQAKGDSRLLKEYSSLCHFGLRVFRVRKINSRPISSTYIRRLITRGELLKARQLLGRPVSIYGSVTQGIGLARKLGFPTANINPHHEVLPPSGVYTVKVSLDDKQGAPQLKKFNGVCNIGRRPTLNERGLKNVEVYIFGLTKGIYGKNLEVQFIKKIREEKKFSSLQALAAQIKKDVVFARKRISLH